MIDEDTDHSVIQAMTRKKSIQSFKKEELANFTCEILILLGTFYVTHFEISLKYFGFSAKVAKLSFLTKVSRPLAKIKKLA